MIKDYSTGQQFIEFLAVRKSTVGTARNGSPFLSLQLSDGETEIPAKLWDFQGEVKPLENSVIKVDAKMDEYQGSPQLILQRWRQAEEGECDPAKFIPTSPRGIEEMWQELQGYLNMIQHQVLSQYVSSLLNEHEDDFAQCPAALYHHHAYIGGLLEHSLGVIQKALAMVPECANKDILIAGAILHDLGKIIDYDWSGCSIEMTDEGKLYGHIINCSIILDSHKDYFAMSGRELDKNLYNSLLHLIASHHGKLEWGSPVEPATKEAIILHQADYLDVQMFKVSQAEENTEGGQWTERIRGINREFYKLPEFEDKEKEAAEEPA